jgi:hypothetical protein
VVVVSAGTHRLVRMASTNCGYCGRLAHMEAASGLHLLPSGMGSVRQAAYKCPNCFRLNLATEWIAGRATDTAVLAPAQADRIMWTKPSWMPRYKEVRSFPDVPEHIAEAAAEATLCLSVGAYRAVGSLARAVIEATAKDKGAKGKSLADRIDALHEADHLRKHTQGQAHEVRYFGNDMAHGDFVQPTTKEEAEEVIELMAEILDEVYQSPARLEKRRSARLSKKDEN